MPIAIRDAKPDDAGDVAALLGDMGYPASPEEAVDHIRRFDDDPGSRLQLAEDAGRVIGLVATHIVPRLDRDELSCRITDIVVGASYRRAGVGSALVAAVEREARDRGARRLDLSSGEWRTDAYAFYARMGFETQSRGFTRRLS